MKLEAAKLNYVVWIQTAFIGDVVLTTAAMAKLRTLAPHIKQFLITTQAGQQVASGILDAKEIFVFDKRKESLFKTALKFRATFRQLGLNTVNTAVLQVHRSFRSTLFAKSLGYPIVTYHETKLSFLATTRVPRVMVLHEADRIALLLEGIGYDRRDILGGKPQLPKSIPSDSWQVWRQSLKDQTVLIGIAPGSVWATKRWPLEYYKELVGALLLLHKNIQIVILGSKDELEYTSALRAATSQNSRVFQFVGRSNLAELAGIMNDLSLLICNDSSPLHFASAANTPCVAIFGATKSQMGFGPLSSRAKVVEHQNLSCRPCSDHGPNQCPLSHFKCMREVSPSEVLAAAVSLINIEIAR